MIPITNGLVDWSEIEAYWPLKSVTFGACRTFDRRSPWAASMKN